MSRIFSFILLTLAIFCGVATVSALAQTVVGVRNISFGSFYRGGTSTVPTTSANCAEFTVTGRQNRNVRITVSNTNLTRTGASMTLTLSNANCSFSLDGGVTWTPFTTGTLFQDTTLPNGVANGSDGTIIVRVGGSLTAGALQANGVYNGTITVTGAYR